MSEEFVSNVPIIRLINSPPPFYMRAKATEVFRSRFVGSTQIIIEPLWSVPAPIVFSLSQRGFRKNLRIFLSHAKQPIEIVD
jgi:hypothetical protein